MIEWVFAFLVFYLLYKLIFDFIVPVYRTTSQMRDKMNQMNNQYQQHSSSPKTTSNEPINKRPSSDDYIDFEEVK